MILTINSIASWRHCSRDAVAVTTAVTPTAVGSDSNVIDCQVHLDSNEHHVVDINSASRYLYL